VVGHPTLARSSFRGRQRAQTELPYRNRWDSRVELTNAIFEYQEVFLNRQRRRSELGWPDQMAPFTGIQSRRTDEATAARTTASTTAASSRR